MQKRIYFNMVLLAFLSMAGAALYLIIQFYYSFSKQMEKAALYKIIAEALPFIVAAFLLLFIIAMMISSYLARRIVAPIMRLDINNDDYDKDLYEELTPFASTIAKQKEQIGDQWLDLEKQTNTIQTVTDGMREGLILIDSDEKVLSANKSALKYCTGGLPDPTGKSILVLTRNIELLNCIRKAIKGESGSCLLETDAHSVQAFINPVWQGELIKGALVLFLDVTSQARAERIRKEFSANVSHELKTPLTTILGYAELIHTGMAEEHDVLLFAGKIKIEVTKLIGLIEAVIRLSELDENITGEQKETFDLNQLLLEVIERLKLFASENNIKITADNPAIVVNANRSMLEELLFNLIDNAIKYNKTDGWVKIQLENAESKTIIMVSDGGIGISAEHLDRIFERFYRVDQSRSKKTGGSGLGLSIVKHIALYHQGSVSIESEKGQGTKVTVVLE